MNYPTLRTAVLSIAMSSFCLAQEAPGPVDLLAGRPDQDVSATEQLGPVFESAVAGISLRPPAGGKVIRRPGDAEVVRYVYEPDGAAFIVVQSTPRNPTPLTSTNVPGATTDGMLEMAVADLKGQHPAAQIIRQDLTNVGDGSVGIIVARYSLGTSSFLSQQAIVQGSPQLYYTLTYVTPGSRPNTPEESIDPREQRAFETFSAVLDTVKLLDRSNIKMDQDQRLYRTRAFFVNLSQRAIENALVPEQWFRILKNGKDIGYLYTVEEKTKLGGFPAIQVGMRSRTFDDKKRQVDAEAWLRMSTDRKHEQWSRLSVAIDGDKRTHATEIGASDHATKAVAEQLDRDQQMGGVKPGIRMVDDYPLTVKYAGSKGAPEPVERQLPPWYMPQALGHILPRALPLGERKGYLFATFVPDRREVMMRYVDTLPSRQVTFAGQTVRATPIEEKIGLDGYVTTHYIEDGGRYLGSETKYPDESGTPLTISYVATTSDDLAKRWEGLNLSRPSETPQVEPNGGNGR
ncbi:MAG TPA: hypothetical protein VGN72_14700 [Tepidisphaeraceae bacterium]|nr:hypothetical protein [Tepidisphaeraceae bacterium]